MIISWNTCAIFRRWITILFKHIQTTYIGQLKLHRKCLPTGVCIWIYSLSKANSPSTTHHLCTPLQNHTALDQEIRRADSQIRLQCVTDVHCAALCPATTTSVSYYARLTRSHPDSSVLNLSKTFSPSAMQLSLLERGLTFIPSPSTFDTAALRRDIHQYHRRIKTMDHPSN